MDDGAPIYIINAAIREPARLLRYTPMCILLNFPRPDDPRPEPPAPAMCMPRPVGPAMTNAVSVNVLPGPPEGASSPFFQTSALRPVA